MTEMTCRLCGADASPFHRDRSRSYFRCGVCAYIFAAEASLPTNEEAKARYDQHRNDPQEPGYRSFLSRLTVPLAAKLRTGDRGLDFGCGPGPAVSLLLKEAGYPTADYDPLYQPDEALLRERYDFVTCTETAEHFTRPLQDWERMFSLVKPEGWLAVMTQLSDGVDFAAWRYKDDFTHVGFYSKDTLAWLARRFEAGLTLLPDSVALFRTSRA